MMALVRFVAEHATAIQWAVGVTAAAMAATLARLALQADDSPSHRHGRRRTVHRGLPSEIRCHGRAVGTYAGTRSVRVVPPPVSHVLDGTAERPWLVANLIESTQEITRDQVARALAAGPVELAGVSA